MALDDYMANRTGLLLVDPYNDYLSDGGKLWPKAKAVADAVGLIAHLRALVEAARKSGVVVFYVPHRRWCEGNYDGWRYPGPCQTLIDRETLFGEGMWGGEWHPELAPQSGDVVIEQQYRPRLPAQATRHRKNHRGGNGSEHLCRDDRPLRHRTRLSRNLGARRDSSIQLRGNACGSRNQRADLRARHSDHRRDDSRASQVVSRAPARFPAALIAPASLSPV